MTLQLSDEQRAAVQQHPNQAIQVVDVVTQEQYVLLPAETYKRVQALFAGDYDPDEFMPLVHDALADDLDAPGMELYDDYDAHRSKT